MIKRNIVRFLIFILLVTFLPSLQTQSVKASGSYTYACNTAYSVDWINDSGSFDNVGCYNDVNSAKNKMFANNDYVVRARDSLSPTKIVMMNSGVVYSYPFRLGSNTITLTSRTTSASTYVTYHREMLYQWTNDVDGASGTIAVLLNGFEGYINLKGVDLVPTKYLTNNLPIILGGNDTTAANEQPFTTYLYQSHYEVYSDSGIKKIKYIWSSGWSSNLYPATYTHVLGPCDSSIPNGVYYSYDGYNFYSDRSCNNKSFTYYNYYQFVPLRSKTNLTADQLNSFINANTSSSSKLRGAGQYFINAQNKYGINAALVLAIACLESGYGSSNYAVNRNNLFGIAAYDSNPDSATYFSSVEECINQMMGVLLKDYSDIKDYRFFGSYLGNKGSGVNVKYAADPYWGIKIASIYYSIDSYCNGNNLQDYNSVSMGLISTYNASIKSNSSSSSSTLFTTANKYSYQVNYIIPILNQSNDYYAFQCNNKISNGGIVSNGYEQYSWDESVAYVKTSDVTLINKASSDITVDGTTPTGDFSFTASLAWNNDTLVLSGSAYRPGIKVNDNNTITHSVRLENTILVSSEQSVTTSIGDDSISSSYTSNIDLNKLSNGTYKFIVNTIYGQLTDYNDYEHIVSNINLPQEKTIDNKVYSFSLSDDKYVLLTVSNKPTVTPDVEPVKPDDGKKDEYVHDLMSSLQSVSYEKGLLKLTGTAYITNIDALEENKDNISIKVIMKNLVTDYEYELDTSLSVNEFVESNGQFTYEYTKYNASINLNDFLNSDIPTDLSTYVFYIQITNGDVTSEKTTLRSGRVSNEFKQYDADNDLMIWLSENYYYLERVELNLEKIDFDYKDSTVNKIPSNRETYISARKYSMENDSLNLVGNAYICLTDVNKNMPTGTIYIVNLETGETKECEVTFTSMSEAFNTGLNHSVTNYRFTSSINLSDLNSGTYKFLLKMNVIDDSGNEYISIDEITSNILNKTLTYSNDTYQYSLYRSNVRSRIVLQIEE